MQEFLSIYSKIENPTFEMVLFTFLLSFLLSALIAFTYNMTTRSTLRTTNFIQSLILSALIATMVLQAIGDNVASGLGMLGALTVIQFRTALRNPRDIVFMFAALGTGIACGLYGFFIAILGVFFFCLLAIVLSFTPFHYGRHIVWELRIRMEESAGDPGENFIQVMRQYCQHWTLDSVNLDRIKDNAVAREYDYTLLFKDDTKQPAFLQALLDNGVAVRRLNKQNDELTL